MALKTHDPTTSLTCLRGRKPTATAALSRAAEGRRQNVRSKLRSLLSWRDQVRVPKPSPGDPHAGWICHAGPTNSLTLRHKGENLRTKMGAGRLPRLHPRRQSGSGFSRLGTEGRSAGGASSASPGPARVPGLPPTSPSRQSSSTWKVYLRGTQAL
jgi:hypothetical protein